MFLLGVSTRQTRRGWATLVDDIISASHASAVQLYEFPNWAQSTASEELRQAELKRLDQQIQETEDQINQLRKPVKHHFEIKPVD